MNENTAQEMKRNNRIRYEFHNKSDFALVVIKGWTC